MRSIRSKLWLGMMVLVGTIIILLWLFQITFLERFYSVLEVNNIVNNTKKIGKEIETLENLEMITSSNKLISQLEKLVYEKQLSIEIVDVSKDIIYRNSNGNNTSMPGSMKTLAAQSIQTALNGKTSKLQMTHPKFGYQFLLIGLPIKNENIVNGAILITMPMAAMDDTADILKKQLVIIIGILLFAASIISFRLSKRFANPILKISRQVEAYTVGQFKVRNDDVGKDEIGQLASRMNHMGNKLMQNEILQKEIIANVSHELRTPLALIRGYAETLRDVTGDNPEKRSKQLNIIVEESERLSDIVEDILNLSQLQSGAMNIDKKPFSLKEMIIKIQEYYMMQKVSRSFQIKGVMELQEDVLGDQRKIEQVFRNLIDNAFCHTTEEELVEITVIPKHSYVRVEITDHGEGITIEDQVHIFERYYRGKMTEGKKSKGTGLGLAIVKSIMDLHQMPYGVISEPGKGTTFWIDLELKN